MCCCESVCPLGEQQFKASDFDALLMLLPLVSVLTDCVLKETPISSKLSNFRA